MTVMRPLPSRSHLSVLTVGLLTVLALVVALELVSCSPTGGRSQAADDDAGCSPVTACDDTSAHAAQVRLDTQAMLAGMAHARARLGLLEDAAP